jgi:hypothetical protein
VRSNTLCASSGISPCCTPGNGSAHPGIFGVTVASTRVVVISQRLMSHSPTRCAPLVFVNGSATRAGVALVPQRFGIGFRRRSQGCYCCPSWTRSTRLRCPLRSRSARYTHRQLSERGERWWRPIDWEGRGTAGDGPAATSRTPPGARSVSVHAPRPRA